MPRIIQVLGPAYLDRVLRVDRPLVPPERGATLDQSVDGRLEPGDGLTLIDPVGSSIRIDPPEGWPGPTGNVRLSHPLLEGAPAWSQHVRGTAWQDDLGGMGAGYAAAFGAELRSALGPEDDSQSRAVARLLRDAGIAHRPIRVPERPADWTLLVTSAGHGDKLPIGFRGCHAALRPDQVVVERPCDLRVVAGLPNRLASAALRAPGAAVRFFAPASRNMLDRDPPVSAFADAIDVLSCNRREWNSLADRDAVASGPSIRIITDGPIGSLVFYRREDGGMGQLSVPAFPRAYPPRDTNRAGEAYASTFLKTLLDAGWFPGPTPEGLIRRAAWRAAAASALVLDRVDFGFPTPGEVDEALRAGQVG